MSTWLQAEAPEAQAATAEVGDALSRDIIGTWAERAAAIAHDGGEPGLAREEARALANTLNARLEQAARRAHAAATGRRYRDADDATVDGAAHNGPPRRRKPKHPMTQAAAALEREEAQLHEQARRLTRRLHELGGHIMDADRANDGLVLRLARAETRTVSDELDEVCRRAARAGFDRFREDLRAYHDGEMAGGLRAFFRTLRATGGSATSWSSDVEPTVVAYNTHLPADDARAGAAELHTGVQATRDAVLKHFQHIYRPAEADVDAQLLAELYDDQPGPPRAASTAAEVRAHTHAAFTGAEVKEALKGAVARTGGWSKSTGPDGISTGLWLFIADMPAPGGAGDHDTAADVMATLFNLCRAAGVVPDSWKRATLSLIPKSNHDAGSTAADLRTLRSVSLLSTAYKCFERLLMTRAGALLKAALAPEQGVVTGMVRGGVSTTAATLMDIVDTTLDATRAAGPTNRAARRAMDDEELRETEAEAQGPEALAALSIDFAKAFDRVPHEALPLALRRLHAPEWLVLLVADAHDGLEATVRLPGVGQAQATDTFKVAAGVRQGSVWGPLLFAAVLDPLVSALREASSRRDRFLAANRLPGVLVYADDVTLLATTERAMRSMTRRLKRFSRATGMAVNEQKCALAVFAEQESRRNRALGVRRTADGRARVGHLRVPAVTEFRYLGYQFATDRSTERQCETVRVEVQRRLAQMARFGLRHTQWLTAYTMWVQSYIAFHGRVWALAETTDLGEQLDKAVRRVARRAMGMPCGSTNAALHSDLGMGVTPPSDTLRLATLAQLTTTLNEPSEFGRLARDRWARVSERLGMPGEYDALAVPHLASTHGSVRKVHGLRWTERQERTDGVLRTLARLELSFAVNGRLGQHGDTVRAESLARLWHEEPVESRGEVRQAATLLAAGGVQGISPAMGMPPDWTTMLGRRRAQREVYAGAADQVLQRKAWRGLGMDHLAELGRGPGGDEANADPEPPPAQPAAADGAADAAVREAAERRRRAEELNAARWRPRVERLQRLAEGPGVRGDIDDCAWQPTQREMTAQLRDEARLARQPTARRPTAVHVLPRRVHARTAEEERGEATLVATDGSYDAKTGAGAWAFVVAAPGTDVLDIVCGPVPHAAHSSFSPEIWAIVMALRHVRAASAVKLWADNEAALHTVQRAERCLRDTATHGGAQARATRLLHGVAHESAAPVAVAQLVDVLRERHAAGGARVEARHVRAHAARLEYAEQVWNDLADQAAKRALAWAKATPTTSVDEALRGLANGATNDAPADNAVGMRFVPMAVRAATGRWEPLDTRLRRWARQMRQEATLAKWRASASRGMVVRQADAAWVRAVWLKKQRAPLRRFLARAVDRVLPAGHVLLRCRMVRSEACQLCGAAVETVEHIFTCDWSRRGQITPLVKRVQQRLRAEWDTTFPAGDGLRRGAREVVRTVRRLPTMALLTGYWSPAVHAGLVALGTRGVAFGVRVARLVAGMAFAFYEHEWLPVGPAAVRRR
ncbi:MAG: reverse transcriptase domain-containing protein [Myxococcota bacterium]